MRPILEKLYTGIPEYKMKKDSMNKISFNTSDFGGRLYA